MSSELAGVQIVMRFGSWKPHSSKEIQAYKRFVELGGSLMLLFRLPENGEFDRLADAFGIRIERSSGDLTNWPTSAIRFDWLDDHPASPALGLIPYGKGKVLFASIATARLLLEIQQPLVDNLLFTLSKGVEEAGPWLLAPEQQALLENGCDGAFVWEFDWMDTPGATHYWLYVFRQNAGGPAVDRSNLTVSAFQHRSTGYVGSHNTGGWRWKVRAKIDGQWGKWSEERTFNVKVCKGN